MWLLGYEIDCFNHEFFEVIEKHIQFIVLKDRAVVVTVIWWYFSEIMNLMLIYFIDPNFAKIEPSDDFPTHNQIPFILNTP